MENINTPETEDPQLELNLIQQARDKLNNNQDMENYPQKLSRQNMFAQYGGVTGQFATPLAAIATMVLLGAPLLVFMPSFVAALGVLFTLLILSTIVGNILGRMAGMTLEYSTRAPEMSF